MTINKKGEKNMNILTEISGKLQNGKAKDVAELVQKALDDGMAADEILNGALLPGMDIVSKQFSAEELFVPEVLIAAMAMNAGMNILKPILSASGIKPIGKCVIGTVKGDLHDIGKNLVKMIMESKGLEVIDLGADVPAERFIDVALENNCRIIAVSAMLTTTMTVMKDIIDLTEARGVRDRFKIMIGGAPTNQSYADNIGGDGYAPDATQAAAVALELLT